MDALLPFRLEEEKNFINSIHPSVRLISPFILVIPGLLIDDYFLLITVICFSFIFGLISRVKFSRIIKRVLGIIPFAILVTIFIPFYLGDTILYQLNIGITLNIYEEGTLTAGLIFLRIITALIVFLCFYSTLTYSEFIEALTKLRIPSFFVGSLVIMIHYIPILARSNKKILDAQELRGKKMTTYWEKLKTHAFIMGKSLVSNIERSEKIYESLKMRGFSGIISYSKKTLKVQGVCMITLLILFMITLIYLIDLKQIYMEVIGIFLQ
jgi:cobalt/nickel transport system permease protein